MNVEVYSYSIFTTVLGMLVVFLSLSMLSVMMVALKGIFSEKKADRGGRRPAKRPGPEAAGRGEAERQPSQEPQLPPWLPAAVAAYLAEEQEPDRPTADPWNAVVNHYDPWISGGGFSKRGV
jgi:Na+-transporting methylmalonyl-CoA/oxaloacetate decarboxylase gamma subunit